MRTAESLGHVLFKEGDKDIPEEIRDRVEKNYIISMCRLCGKTGPELRKPCKFAIKDVSGEIYALTLFTKENDFIVKKAGFAKFLSKRDIVILNRIQGLIVKNSEQILKK